MKAAYTKSIFLAAAIALFVASSAGRLAQAEQKNSPPTDTARRGPPPESIAACKASKPNAACAFISPKGAETGTCVQHDAQAPLGCRPTRNGPPPEAISACATKTINTTCSFTSPRGSEQGSCVGADSTSPLACRPARAPASPSTSSTLTPSPPRK